MSYSISLSGHSGEPHNEEVKAIAEEAYRKLNAIPGTTSVTLSGYTADNTGSVPLTTPGETIHTESS